MRIIDSARQRLTRLLTAPLEELNSWARFARLQIQLWRFCLKRLGKNNAMAMSSALSFRTIFAMVPALLLVFLTLKSLGTVEDSKLILREFMDRSGLSQITYVDRGAAQPAGAPDDEPPIQITATEKIESLVEHLESQLTFKRLGPAGVALLIWTALTLLTTIERSLNRIFEAKRSRWLGKRILLYWSALTLMPLVLVGAVYVTDKTAAGFQNTPVLSWAMDWLGWAGPVVAGVGLLAGLYTLMPNTHVRFRMALRGAILAVPMWLAAKWAFALYVESIGMHSLYGALGLLPLFLLWLNLSWYIFLFGAELCHTSANLKRMMSLEAAEKTPLTQWHLLAAVLAVARRQRAGRGPAGVGEISGLLNVPTPSAEWLLDRLSETGIVCRVVGDQPPRCVLTAPAERIPVAKILGAGSQFGPGAADEIDETVARVRRRCQAGVENLSLADIL